jgi:hypothetical protein
MSATIGRMDTHGYRLALTDRAFAFDGAYRVPTSLSLADRSVYGLRDSAAREPAGGFATILRAAVCGKLQCGENRYIRRTRPIKCGADRYGRPTGRIKCKADVYVRPADLKGPPYIRPADHKGPPYIRPADHIGSPYMTVRAAIGDVALQIVALRGRVFIGVHSKCSTPK